MTNAERARRREISAAIFAGGSCLRWIVANPVGGRVAALDARHVTGIMADILAKPVPVREEPAAVSGEIG